MDSAVALELRVCVANSKMSARLECGLVPVPLSVAEHAMSDCVPAYTRCKRGEGGAGIDSEHWVLL